MKKITLFAMCLCCTGVFAQVNPHLEEYLEEKVRNEQVRTYLLDHAEAYQEAISKNEVFTPQGPTIEEFLDKNQIELNSKERSFKYDFSVTGGAEPFIAINPTDPNHVVVTYMSAADSDYPIYVSFDAGFSWAPSGFSSLTELDNQYPGASVLGGGDPVFAFDNDGNLHMTYIYVHGSGFNFTAGMYYVNSTDGGLTFDVPAGGHHIVYEGDVFSSDLLDRQWMHCDKTGSAHDGTLYMSAVYFGGGFGTAGELVLKKTPADTGFSSYTVAVPHNGGNSTQFGNLKVDNNGTVHMGCIEMDGNGVGQIVYVQSTDQAATFTSPLVIANATTALPNGGTHLIHGRDNSSVSTAVDGNNIFMTWTDMNSTDVRAYLAYSTDGGTSFSSPIEFGYDLFGPGYFDLMPNVAADAGNASITWYHVDSVTLETNYVMADFDASSGTFTGSQIISNSSTDFMNENGSDFYGDYNASERKNCNTYSVFCDGSTGSPVVYFINQNACALGVKDVLPVNGLLQMEKIYPNPVNDMITLNASHKSGATAVIEILDLNGKVVHHETRQLGTQISAHNLNVSELSAGTYQLRVSAKEEYAVQGFVKR